MYSKLVKSSILLIVITIVSKLLGLIREMVMANYLGTSAVSDAYVLGTTLSQIVITGLAGAFFKTYVPIAMGEMKKSNKQYIDFTCQLIFLGTALFFGLSCVVYVTAPYTSYWLSSGASQDVISMAKGVCKVTAFPSALLLSVNILQGYLHSQEKFLSNIIYPVVMNVTIIGGFIIGGGDIQYLSFSYGASIIFSAFALWIYCRRNGFKGYSLNGMLHNPAIRKSVYLTLPLFFGGIVSEINEIIDRSFSAFYAEGVLTALRFGKLLEIFIVSAIGISIGQAIYPKISELKHDNKIQELNVLISKIIRILSFLCIPIFFEIIILGKEIVSMIFMRGHFDSKSVDYTAVAFSLYSFSILSVSINEILSRVFFAYNDSIHPVIYSMISMGINIILNGVVVFGLKLDFYTLAITTSLSETIMAILYYYGIKRVLKLKIRIYYNSYMKEVFSALMMGGCLFVIKKYLPNNSLIQVCILSIGGISIYLLINYIINREELVNIMPYIRKKEMR